MSKFKVYNGFGIKPTKAWAAAGWDFYVPEIVSPSKEVEDRVIEAFKKSYNKTDKQLETILGRFENEMKLFNKEDDFNKYKYSILLLFLSLDGAIMRASQNKVATFVSYYLIWNDEGKPGIVLHCNDHVFINTGIKVCLDHDTAGIFFNKSGRGNKGIDVRAQVVDEDYAGYVHLSHAYTKDNVDDGRIFAGDKLSQMCILPLIHKDECEEIDAKSYNKMHESSERGDGMCGSSDKKK